MHAADAAAPATDADQEVLVRRSGQVGHLVLNRPRAINSLTHAMVRRLDAALTAWERDESVRTILVTGAGERGLCAGGDIRAVYEDARVGGHAAREFWREEYLLNGRIARYPKPYVAIMDGIVMGGGVGISAHGDVRIVTERSRVAMPETGIGLVPDVGGTFLLARAPGGLGTHLALTGDAIGPGDALLCGLADHYIPAARLAAFTADLAGTDPAQAVARYAAAPPDAELAGQRSWIDACYSADTVEEILDRLAATGVAAAKQAAEKIAGNSPTAVKATLRSVREARRAGTLEAALRQEYRASCASLDSPDLVEGIRAQIIDKDRRPRWNPAGLGEVREQDVERYFTAPPGGDLDFGA
jgi:enoyl-CoA hydratase